MRLVRKPITIVNRMTTIGSVAKIRAVSAFGSMYAEIYSGSAMNSCQKTIQYPVKISRKIMNCGFESTVRKFLPTWPRLAASPSSARRGSLKNSSTTKSIRNTLNAAMRNTLSTLPCCCAQEASSGPAVLPTFTSV